VNHAASDDAFFSRCRGKLSGIELLPRGGRVISATGDAIEIDGIRAPIGAVCEIDSRVGSATRAEIVGFRDRHSIVMALGERAGIEPGARVRLRSTTSTVPAGHGCLGRVIDGLANPIDGRGPLVGCTRAPLYGAPVSALTRSPIAQPFSVGVPPIDGLLTLGVGSRIGLFAGSGVGKSTLLGRIAQRAEADVSVVALIGERGREVREFVERDLGPALARSVVVVSTSDEAPLLRLRAAHTAAAIAEDFRARGLRVLWLTDSLTRFCTARREIGLAAGEPPATRGFPPSVWSALPKLIERAGNAEGPGSITAIFTVLVEGDDPGEPVADAARSLLDGHIMLSRELAERGQYPPIDLLASVSRVMPAVVPREQLRLAGEVRESLATYRRMEELISIGAYREGSDPAVDRARKLEAPLRAFFTSQGGPRADLAQTRDELARALGAVAPTPMLPAPIAVRGGLPAPAARPAVIPAPRPPAAVVMPAQAPPAPPAAAASTPIETAQPETESARQRGRQGRRGRKGGGRNKA
jgi:flagellum-specific ATP synthase